MDMKMTTTAFEIPGQRIVRNLGVVRGVTVRSRGLVGQLAASLRTIAGGKIHEYVSLCEQTRAEAFELMLQHAQEQGANAIIGVRYDATELGENMTEVLAYGTAVIVEAA
ncbi:MAG: heavy metal-binding domain-containing protein [Chloroflexi bacterium]|nr:heavy metal-binding domain-containing protein [Chloroflexota bacterium]